jgi:hypothetical protein
MYIYIYVTTTNTEQEHSNELLGYFDEECSVYCKTLKSGESESEIA